MSRNLTVSAISWLAFLADVVFYVVAVAKVLPKDFDKKRPFSVASVSIG